LGEDDFAHGEVVGCLYGVQSGLGVEFHQSVLKAAGESLFSCAFEKDSGELFVEAVADDEGGFRLYLGMGYADRLYIP